MQRRRLTSLKPPRPDQVGQVSSRFTALNHGGEVPARVTPAPHPTLGRPSPLLPLCCALHSGPFPESPLTRGLRRAQQLTLGSGLGSALDGELL